MSRALLLMRHAQAESGDGLADFDRALTDRGRSQSEAVGRLLADQGYVLDHVLCSAAQRARQTLTGVLGTMEPLTAPEVDYSEAAYSAGPDALLEMVSHVGPDARTVLVVAHNPTVAQVAASFMGTLTSFSPATVAVVDLEVEWLYAAPGTGTGKLLN